LTNGSATSSTTKSSGVDFKSARAVNKHEFRKKLPSTFTLLIQIKTNQFYILFWVEFVATLNHCWNFSTAT
jgi:hypothetical protein